MTKGMINMKESLYVYNSGTLSRKDNTLRFTNENGEKKDIPIMLGVLMTLI